MRKHGRALVNMREHVHVAPKSRCLGSDLRLETCQPSTPPEAGAGTLIAKASPWHRSNLWALGNP